MKPWFPWTLLVLIAILFGYSCSQQRQAEARHLQETAAMRDSLHIADSLSQILNHRADSVRLVAVILQAKLDTSRIQLYAYSIQNVAYEATLDSLIQTIPDTQIGSQIGSAVAELRGELRLCHSTLGLCDSLNVVLTRRNVVLDTLYDHQSATITTLRTAWEAAERRTKQSNFGIGATCGFASTPAGSGLGCAVGFTYRVRFAWPW